MKRTAFILSLLIFVFAISSHSYCEETSIREWAPYSGVDVVSSMNNVLTLRSTSAMPLLVTRDNMFINASLLKVLEIKMRSDKSYMTGRMFFRRIGDPGFNYYNSFEFQTGLNNMYHSYLIDLGRNPNWFGTVTQIMLSPINNEGRVEVESVRFLEPGFWLKCRIFWQELFVFERPLPRTINFIYGPKISGISINTYVYWAILLVSLALGVLYWIKAADPGELMKVAPIKIILTCFIFWALLDARSAFDQFRYSMVDAQVFGGKSFEEKQALSTNGSFRDFYYYLKFCGEKVPSGSTFSLAAPPNVVYFIDKAKYYLYPTYEDTMEAQYVLVYDPQKEIKAGDLPGKGFKKFADFGNNRYLLKRSGL